MPLRSEELRRGRIVYAIYPFVPEFPLQIVGGSPISSVEQFASKNRGRPAEIISEGRLRPVLLLHDGTRGEHHDVLCLRINTIKPSHRRSETTWEQIERGDHPFFFRLPPDRGYGLRQESIIALSSVNSIHKTAILGPRHVGEVGSTEMKVISERLSYVLSLDLSSAIATKALELIRKSGIVPKHPGKRS